MAQMVIVGVRFPQYVIDKLDQVAESRGITRSDLIRQIVYENIGPSGMPQQVVRVQEVRKVSDEARRLFGPNFHGMRSIP